MLGLQNKLPRRALDWSSVVEYLMSFGRNAVRQEVVAAAVPRLNAWPWSFFAVHV
jgi:hypothetical protein